MRNVLDAAFSHPRGPLGLLGRVIMARSTALPFEEVSFDKALSANSVPF